MGGAIGPYAVSRSQIPSLDDWIAQQNSRNTSARTKFKILGVGPATNVWQLISGLGAENISDVTLMSGVIFDSGNITEHAEFNAYCDPMSLQKVLTSGVPITLVPLDLCRKILFPRSNLACLDAFGPASAMLKQAHAHYMDQYKIWEGVDGCFPHDAIALLAALFPERFLSYGMDLTVDVAGEFRGRMTVNGLRSDSAVRVVLGGDLKWARDFFRFSGNTLTTAWQG